MEDNFFSYGIKREREIFKECVIDAWKDKDTRRFYNKTDKGCHFL